MSDLEEVTKHLQKMGIDFSVIELEDPLTRTNLEVLSECGISIEHLVVGNILNRAGRACMAITPATHLVDIASMSLKLSSKFKEIDEDTFPNAPEISEFGYVALPKLLGTDAIVEESISKQEWVFLPVEDDDGDYFIKLSVNEFKKAIGDDIQWVSFSIDTLTLKAPDNENGIEENTELGVPRYNPAALHRRLNEQHEFPVMSPTAQKILKLQSDPNAEIEDLARIVEQSPTLAAQVIKWANSPYYGFPGSIKTIHDAIVKVLGFDMVMNMALGLAIGDKFKAPVDGPIGLANHWQHSVCTAALVEHIVKKMPASNRPLLGLAYLSGLLHNFGFLLLGELFPSHFNVINSLISNNKHLTILQIERSVLGVCHTQLGSWLMETWHMPEELITTTLYHHSGVEEIENNELYVALVSASISLLARLDLGDAITTMVEDETLEVLGIEEDTVDEALEEIEDQYEELCEFSKMLVS